MTLSEAAKTLRQVAEWIDWDIESINLIHGYAHEFGAKPGSNVFLFLLTDALERRGITMEQFQEMRKGK
jgi:hypothetical protein